jgi:exodeoxyribonuclease VII small subunit
MQGGSLRLTTISLSHSRMAKRPAPDGSDAVPQTYEDALAELERLVADMEGGQLPLDRLVEGYRRGAELLGFCRGRLQAVEEQVKVLEQGQLKPWIAG